jgi:hypothetical protein
LHRAPKPPCGSAGKPKLVFEGAGGILRVLPYWPEDRYLELAPDRWQSTRSKLRADELDAPLCSFTIPAA